MANKLKSKLFHLIDSIEDENVLQMLMEDITYYANKKDIIDELDKNQLAELNEAIAEVDNNDTIDWEDFKKEMNEWKKS